MASSKINVTDLDFAQIKSNLKTFLKAQSEFQDYNFEGSGLSVLLDTLSYNTHYMAFLANMATNEVYLDSADIRKNIVSMRSLNLFSICNKIKNIIAGKIKPNAFV